MLSTDLNEGVSDRVGLLGSLYFEGVPALLIEADVLAVDQGVPLGLLSSTIVPGGRLDLELAAEARRNVDAVIMIAGLPIQGTSQAGQS